MPDPKEEKPKTKRCPFCAEIIQAQAVKCRYCCEFLDPRIYYTSAPPALSSTPPDAPEAPPKPADDKDEEEKEIFYSRPSIFALGRLLVTSVLMFAFAMFLCFYPLDHFIKPTGELTGEQSAAIIGYIRVVGLALAVATVLVVAYKIADLKSISYEVTPDRVEWARGVFGRKRDNLDMFRVLDLRLHQNFVDVLLGIGTLTVITRDVTDPQFEFVKIRKPKYLYDIIKKASLEADRKQRVVHLE